MFTLRLLTAGAVAIGGAASALAQGCDTPAGCGSAPLFGTGALFAPNKHLGRSLNANQPLCATKTYPISDWAYIRKFCGPTLNPGTCYGYYPTKWRRWEEACPTGNGCAAGLSTAMPILVETAPIAPLPTPMPAPIPPAKDPIPKPDVSQEAAPISVAPAPLPMIGTTPAIPVKPAEHGKPDGAAPMLPLRTLPNIVVPPVRDFPERSRN